MQKQQRLIGLMIVIIVAIGVTLTTERSGGVNGTGTTGSGQVRATSVTIRPRASALPATSRPQTSTRRTPPSIAPAAPEADGLPTILVSELPREARQTINLIQQGGPFPYDKDGSTFRNREGILPRQRNGYYREYTVETPGSDDRGARRIVAGERGELYYTDDHYDSFSRIR